MKYHIIYDHETVAKDRYVLFLEKDKKLYYDMDCVPWSANLLELLNKKYEFKRTSTANSGWIPYSIHSSDTIPTFNELLKSNPELLL